MNVLELVNSMGEEPAVRGSYDDLENRPNKLFTPNKYITHGKGKLNPYPSEFLQWNIPPFIFRTVHYHF